MNKNLTLSIDETILHHARHEAVEHELSLSQWVVTLIAREVNKQTEYEKAKKRALQMMESGFKLGGKPLTRDEIYER